MPQKTINPNLGAGKFLFGQHDPNKSSEHGMLVANSGALQDGTVMAKFTGGGNVGKWTKFDPAGANGAATAAGFLYGDKADNAADQRVVLVVRDDIVNGNLIVYAAAATDNQKAAAELALAANQLIVRR